MKVKILAHTLNADRVVAESAKLCYSPVGIEEIDKNLTDEQVEKFLNHLVSIGHESPLEHATFTFGIEGISRVCTHQIVRHRIASYSQQSQRYVKLEQFEYIIPPEIERNEKAKKIFIEQMELSQKAYNKITDILMINALDNKYPNWEDECSVKESSIVYNIDEVGYYPREFYLDSFKELHPREYNSIEKSVIEDARYVFPNACETKMVITMNARSLMNFFELRCCERAQWEIRDLANEMLRQVKEVAPILFKNAGAPCVRGKCPEGSMSCGKPKR